MDKAKANLDEISLQHKMTEYGLDKLAKQYRQKHAHREKLLGQLQKSNELVAGQRQRDTTSKINNRIPYELIV